LLMCMLGIMDSVFVVMSPATSELVRGLIVISICYNIRHSR